MGNWHERSSVYLVLWIYGLLVDKDSDADFASHNSADDWLHLGLGVAMIALGIVLDRSSRPSTSATTSRSPDPGLPEGTSPR